MQTNAEIVEGFKSGLLDETAREITRVALANPTQTPSWHDEWAVGGVSHRNALPHDVERALRAYYGVK